MEQIIDQERGHVPCETMYPRMKHVVARLFVARSENVDFFSLFVCCPFSSSFFHIRFNIIIIFIIMLGIIEEKFSGQVKIDFH